MFASVSLPRPRSEAIAEESEAVSDSNMAAPADGTGAREYKAAAWRLIARGKPRADPVEAARPRRRPGSRAAGNAAARSRRLEPAAGGPARPVTSRSDREQAHTVLLSRRLAGKSGASPEGPTASRRTDSAEGAGLDDDRDRAGHRHRAATLATAGGGSGAGRTARRPVHRLAAGGLAGLGRTGAGGGRGTTHATAPALPTGRTELHERRAAAVAAARASETARAAGGCSEPCHSDRQAQRSAHDSCSPPPDRGTSPQRSGVVRDASSKP